MIDHEDLKKAMPFVIEKAYKGSKKENISLYASSARW